MIFETRGDARPQPAETAYSRTMVGLLTLSENYKFTEVEVPIALFRARLGKEQFKAEPSASDCLGIFNGLEIVRQAETALYCAHSVNDDSSHMKFEFSAAGTTVRRGRT